MKHRARLDLLNMAVAKWMQQPKTSRTVVIGQIVDAVERCGLTETLAHEGVTFNTSDDAYNDLRVNGQKLFRWLGLYDGINSFPERLWVIEPAMLAAMPNDIRVEYLNAVFGVSGVFVCNRSTEDGDLDRVRLAASLTKEQMEAQLSVIELSANPAVQAAEAAHKEVSEAVAMGTHVIQALEGAYPELAPAAIS